MNPLLYWHLILVNLVWLVAVVLLMVWQRRLRRSLEDAYAELARLRSQLAEHVSRSAQQDKLLEALMEASFDPILIINNNRQLVAHNPPAASLCNRAAGVTLIEATRSYELDQLAEDVLVGRSELFGEFMVNQRLHRAQAARTLDGAVIVLRDISELQYLGRMRRDFVANISHELRTPLTNIHLLFESLQSNLGPALEHQRLWAQLRDQLDSLTRLVQELSDLAQIESGQMPMRMMRANVREIVESALSRLKPQSDRAGLRMVNEVDSTLAALCDPDQIRRVLSNLLHNAIKFTPQGEVVVFALADQAAQTALQAGLSHDPVALANLKAEDVLVIGVRDTGIGIPSDTLPRVFERFYKADLGRNGRAGSGLGLSIARHIVEAHGGHIWAKSAVGQGSTFYFTLFRERV
ncbi:MAG: sensor histidine kinase [Thermoflexales bacterium]